MKLIKIIIIILIHIFLINCRSKYINPNFKNMNPSIGIEKTISKSKVQILNHIRKNNLDLSGCQIVYGAYLLRDKFNAKCNLNKIFLDSLFSNYEESKIFVTGYVMDNENNCIAYSSNHTLIRNPQELNNYQELQLLTKRIITNHYKGFIEFECESKIYMGFTDIKYDIYTFKDGNIFLIKTINKI